MTIASTSIRSDYTGPGSVFTFNFPTYGQSTLLLIVTNPSGVYTILNYTQYTLVGIKTSTDYSEGGTITLSDILNSGYKLSIISNLSGIQSTSIRNNAEYYAVLHENEFDKLALEDLQNKERIAKCIKAPDSEPAGTTTLDLPSASVRANNTIVFDEDGNLGVQPPEVAVGPQGPEGAVGPQGPEGAVGPQGPAGPAYTPYVYSMVGPSISGTVNDYSPVDTAGKDFADGNVTELGIVGSGNVTLTGIGTSNRLPDTDLFLFNDGYGTITLKSQVNSGASTVGNRFLMHDDVVIPYQGWAMIRYIRTPVSSWINKGWLVTSTGLYQ
jgi:hypothetical protein